MTADAQRLVDSNRFLLPTRPEGRIPDWMAKYYDDNGRLTEDGRRVAKAVQDFRDRRQRRPGGGESGPIVPEKPKPKKKQSPLNGYTDMELVAEMRRLRRGETLPFDVEDLNDDDLDRLDTLIIENRRMFPDRDRSPHPAVELVMGEVNRRADAGRDRRDGDLTRADIDDVLDAPEPEIDAYEAAYGRSLSDLSDEELDAEISMLRRRRKSDLLDEDRAIVDRAMEAVKAEQKRREAPASPRRRRGSPVNVQRLDDVERPLMEEALANERDRLDR